MRHSYPAFTAALISACVVAMHNVEYSAYICRDSRRNAHPACLLPQLPQDTKKSSVCARERKRGVAAVQTEVLPRVPSAPRPYVRRRQDMPAARHERDRGQRRPDAGKQCFRKDKCLRLAFESFRRCSGAATSAGKSVGVNENLAAARSCMFTFCRQRSVICAELQAQRQSLRSSAAVPVLPHTQQQSNSTAALAQQ